MLPLCRQQIETLVSMSGCSPQQAEGALARAGWNGHVVEEAQVAVSFAMDITEEVRRKR